MPRRRPRLLLVVLGVLVVASCGVEAGETRVASGAGEEAVAAPPVTSDDGPAGDDPDGGGSTAGDESAGGGSSDDDRSQDDKASDDDPSDDDKAPDDERSEDEAADDEAADDPETGTGPQRYGDDADFDSLQDDCLAGDERACDVLYLTSPADSAYEAIGETCGGRVPLADRYCAPETDLADDGYSTPDNPGLAVLRRDCVAGDLTACDLLYQISPVGSDHEQTGHTCGGAVPAGAYPSCRSHFEERTV